ncbi:HNH endonuclease signature motif containing protein [Corynebacterium senegalense]|uniref:HNH endonuclease signature motif containing protein n=1 Tax=Corynebacterium senegalense TaxID=2080750 RepID=UPI000E202F75|nr:HNH endonuclease signature motif containing protein [Corynebacterium senegalense]
MTTPHIDNLNQLAPRQLARRIEEGFGLFTRKKAEILYAIALFDAMGLARRHGASSTAMWMVTTFALPNSTAHEYVKVARTMKQFELLAGAFLEGRTSYSRVRLILPLLERGNEAELVELACTLAYHELELALLRFRERQAAPRRESYVRLKVREDGRVGLWADFNAAEGARVMAAMKVGELAWHASDLQDLVGADGTIDDSLLDAEMDRQESRAAGCSGFGLPLNAALVSSFMGLVNIALSGPKNPLRAPGAHVNVVMTTDGRAYLPNNPGAGSEAVKNFLSNANYRVNTVDETGLVLNTGRAVRLATDAQVNALMLMWRGRCAMPGCSHERFIEIHHIREWADGGLTDLDNLLPLCSACHALVSDGWVSILKDGGDVHFVRADGTRYVSYDHGLPERNDDARTKEEFSSCAC